MEDRPRVLLVDDEQNILNAYKRKFRLNSDFELITALGGEVAIDLAKQNAEEKEFSVIISDMRMPNINGVELLQKMQNISPNTVRLMLTGNADQETAIQAINQGKIFRFFNKTGSDEDFEEGIRDALEQYKLITAEKELTEKTLTGSLRVLVDLLEVTKPETFKHTNRLKNWARNILVELRPEKCWEINIAIQLAHIGEIMLPEPLTKKYYSRKELKEDEQKVIHEIPQISSDLLRKIPRLENISKIILHQDLRYDGSNNLHNLSVKGKDIPYGARLLKILNDIAYISGENDPNLSTFEQIDKQKHYYDPDILTSVRQYFLGKEDKPEIQYIDKPISVPISELKEGDKLLSSIVSENESLLLISGSYLTQSQIKMLHNQVAYGLTKVSTVKISREKQAITVKNNQYH